MLGNNTFEIESKHTKCFGINLTENITEKNYKTEIQKDLN